MRVLLFLLLAGIGALLLARGLRRAVGSVKPGAGDGPWDPYAILGVARGASQDEMVHAYREQLKRYHPDRVADLGSELQRLAHRKTLDIQRAYAELSHS